MGHGTLPWAKSRFQPNRKDFLKSELRLQQMSVEKGSTLSLGLSRQGWTVPRRGHLEPSWH